MEIVAVHAEAVEEGNGKGGNYGHPVSDLNQWICGVKHT